MLIKRVYEVDPLACPACGAQMRVISFIGPPQEAVVKRILKHGGLWNPTERAPPVREGFVEEPEAVAETTYVDIDTFLAEF